MPFVWLLIAATAVFEAPPAEVQDAVQAALADPGAEVEVTSFRASLPQGCALAGAEVRRPITKSGTALLRLNGRTRRGQPCAGSGVAQLVVRAAVWVVGAPIAAGMPLEGSVARERREVRGGAPLSSLPQGAVAKASLEAGVVLEAHHVARPGAAPGTSLRVVLRKGQVTVSQRAVVVPCPGGGVEEVCARLPSGKRVAGALADGTLEVMLP